jgi:NADPH2:quinone reductase
MKSTLPDHPVASTTTFASHYTNEVSLTGAIDPAAIAVYAQQATGQKFLIRPTLG